MAFAKVIGKRTFNRKYAFIEFEPDDFGDLILYCTKVIKCSLGISGLGY